MVLAEEKMRSDLISILMYYKDNMSISSQYYVFKDVFNDLANAYDNYVKTEIEKEKNEKETTEVNKAKEEEKKIDVGNVDLGTIEINLD